MILFNLALKNIKRNSYNYFLYFISMIFSIMIYFTFNLIRYNTQILNLTKSTARIDTIFKSSSLIVAIFSGIFIWYSNSFFTKQRKKEIGLYSILGVKKNQIGAMLFFENISIGTLALCVGIFIGSLLSKVFIMLLIKLMGFSINIKFAIIPMAIINTIITFAIIFLITSIHGYTLIYRFKLVDLFKAKNKGQKKPKASPVIALISILLIGGGYLLYLNYPYNNGNFNFVLITLVSVVIGTYLLFSYFTIFAIKLSKKNKYKYYKGINLISTSQLLYRIKGNAVTLATIAVLSATTLTAMGITASMYYDSQINLDSRYPFTYVNSIQDKNLNKKIEEIINKYPQNKILKSINIKVLKIDGYLPRLTKNKSSKPITLSVISQSDFNKIIKARKLKEKIILNDKNDIVVFDPFYNEKFMESYNGKSLELNLNNKKEKFKISDFKDYNLINQHILYTTLIVKDEVFNKYYNGKNMLIINAYITNNKKNSEKLTKELIKLTSKIKKDLQKNNDDIGFFSSYYSNYKSLSISSGLTIFIGSFLSLIFLFANGSIIFFKQLSEANEDKKRYKILKNIGVTKKEIKSSISKQMLFIFLTPLVVGITHSCVAVSLLGNVLKLNLIPPISSSIGAYALIYMIYYLLTVSSYTKIVTSKN